MLAMEVGRTGALRAAVIGRMVVVEVLDEVGEGVVVDDGVVDGGLEVEVEVEVDVDVGDRTTIVVVEIGLLVLVGIVAVTV